MKRVFIETYGCQMNVADSEVIGGILARGGYSFTNVMSDADVILVNTCAIRDNAEQRIYGRIGLFGTAKKEKPGTIIGVLGCMAERLRFKLVEEEKLVDLVVGPDEYRKLPQLIENAFLGEKGIATRLSRVENYEDIAPLRTDGISAWVSVMRGCDKFCTFCVVPFTRGRERSRSVESIVKEVRDLARRGFKDVTLLGQNVNSFQDGRNDFSDLMHSVAEVDRSVRIRFTTSHPQDMSDKLLETIATNDNICKYIHLPVQSGSNRILALMNRTYTVEHYLELVDKIRRVLPGASLTTDIISGFPSETVEEHRMTIDLMERVQYDGAYTFKYSPRENTKAWEMADDVPEDIKGQRVFEISQRQQKVSAELNRRLIGSTERVLVEGPSKRSNDEWTGRTDTNKTAVFPATGETVGEYVDIVIEGCGPATLFGRSLKNSQVQNSWPAQRIQHEAIG